MKRRCLNKNDRRYSDYGGRGILVCEQWVHSFENFLDDMGRCPSPKHSLGRIDNNGNYEPSNCRWETIKQQANNKRTSRFVEFEGRKQTVQQWGEELGIRPGIIWRRLNRGWTVKQALISPLGTHINGLGTDQIQSKLNEDKVKYIREACSSMRESKKQLALKFGVHPSLIYLIVNRKKWAHVE